MADLPDAETFIRANLPLAEVPGTGVRLRLAGPRSRLTRLVPPGETPYWAYAWPGGVALARHLAAHPGTVLGRTVAEIGAGSGLVSIAALLAGARAATAFDSDRLALVALRLNAEANGVGVEPRHGGFGDDPFGPDETPDLLLAGDVFYDEALALAATAHFDRLPAPVTILVGDIGRRFLPRDRLEPLASYPVRDVGDPPSAPLREGWAFRWKPLP